MSNLISKGLKTLKQEGVKSLVKKTKKYISSKKKAPQEVKDVLFINGCYLNHPTRYRVDHQVEQLESNNMTVDVAFFETLDLEKEKYYKAFVFFRCPITENIKEFIKKAKNNNKPIFFDIDDLVFSEEFVNNIKYIKNLSKEEKKLYLDGVNRMRETLEMCDYAITSTEEIAKELKKVVKDVLVNRNVLSEELVKYSLEALKNKKENETINIGYLSGSITHNDDFEIIKKPIIKILEEYKNVKLIIAGLLDLPEELVKYQDQIEIISFKEWQELPKTIAYLDINLAPLVDNKFNMGKSENKWTEAAIVKVATIASNVGGFQIINNKHDGILVNNTYEEWFEGIRKLIEDKRLRNKIAENAYKRVMADYITTYTGIPITNFINSKIPDTIGFVFPTTNISGGTIVALKHAEILKKNGNIVYIVNMDNKDNNAYSDDYEIEVVSNSITKVNCLFDKMIATLWTTVYYMNQYPKVEKKYYLVQGFETNFLPFGNKTKRIINSTYHMKNINYVTVSLWCKKWLREKYGILASYIPNGIDLSLFPVKNRKNKKTKIIIEGNPDDVYKNIDEAFAITNKLDKSKYEIIFLSYQGIGKKWYEYDKFYNRVPHKEVGEVYASCDILLKTSIFEGFSYPPLEMMATGGVSVVFPNEGNQEYLVDNKNCLFYEQGNIEDAIRKIELLVNNKELRDKIIKEGFKTAKERDWSKIESEILKAYR